MRLFVPVGQARVRRFYEREGFTATGEPFDTGLKLPLLEYRRAVTAATRSPADSKQLAGELGSGLVLVEALEAHRRESAPRTPLVGTTTVAKTLRR
jgi:hypothetical protein